MLDRRTTLAFALLLTAPALAQTLTPPVSAAARDSPVGHWIAEHPKGDALELWWNFRADGTVTATAGSIAKTRYKLDGNILTISPSPSGSPAGAFDIHFRNGKLYSTALADHAPTMEFTRIGEPTSSETALVGIWRVSNAPHASDPDEEALRKRMLNLTTVYRADGTSETRMPLDTIEGHWDVAAHTYTLKDHPPLRFSRSPAGLTLALPPNGKDIHLYHPDNFPTP